MAETYDVFISDGNRLSSYDHRTDVKLGEVLKERKYNWLKGSVRVNGKSVPDSAMDETLEQIQRETLMETGRYYTTYMKITCRTPDNDPSKKRETPVRRRERTDVR